MLYKVALIDDDASFTELLSEFLVAENFSVQVSNDGLEGFDSITSNKPDIVVLDIMMPHMNGIEVLKRIRSKSLLPVILLTAKGDDADCVLGLELGADDYVTKPCSPHALVARIRAILRRTDVKRNSSQAPIPILAGPLKLYTTRRRIECDGVALELTSTEFNLLEILIINAGQVVKKSTLSKEGIGRPLTPFDRIVDVHISSIRNKIRHTPGGRSLIKTVIRKGYQLSVE